MAYNGKAVTIILQLLPCVQINLWVSLFKQLKLQ